jgi:hypothetical protein
MRKVNLKLSWDQMNALSQYIDSTVDDYPIDWDINDVWYWRLVQSVMLLWSIKLKQKCVFRKTTLFRMSLDAPTACAFIEFFSWSDLKVTSHLGITVLKIQQQIQEQLN